MTNIVQLDFNELQAAIKDCLRDAITEIKAIPDPPKLPDRCTLPEAAEITGLSRSMLYKLSMDGEIPRQKYGKRLVFSRKALDQWMTARTKTPVTPDAVMTSRLQQSAKKRQ